MRVQARDLRRGDILHDGASVEATVDYVGDDGRELVEVEYGRESGTYLLLSTAVYRADAVVEIEERP